MFANTAHAIPLLNYFEHILPKADNTYDFGTSTPSRAWKAVYSLKRMRAKMLKMINGLAIKTNRLSPSAAGQIVANSSSSILMPRVTRKIAMKKVINGCSRRCRSSCIGSCATAMPARKAPISTER